MKYKPCKNKQWFFWIGEIVDYHEEEYEPNFRLRHVFSVRDIKDKKTYRTIYINSVSKIKKKELPIVGDFVLLSYFKHSDSFNDNKQESKIEEIITEMVLKDYTDEEIAKEYWKRRKAKMKKYEPRWITWEAKILEMVTVSCNYNKSAYKYAFKVEPIIPNKQLKGNELFHVLATIKMKFADYPRVGDIVKLRYKQHSIGENYPDESKIIEIIKRKEDVD